MKNREGESLPSLETEVDPETQRILGDVGLTIEGLRGKVTVDLGSGSSKIEQAAREKGIESVVSLENKPERLPDNPALESRVIAEAEKLPLQDASVDLIISHSGPPLTPRSKSSEQYTKGVLDEMDRVLQNQGEVRISGHGLYFLDPELNNRLAQRRHISKEEEADLSRHRTELIAKTTQFFEDEGYPIEYVSAEQNPTGNKSHFWILRKKENS